MLREPVSNRVSRREHGPDRPYDIRKPRGCRVKELGDLIQLDALDVRPLPGLIPKHFTARDMVWRWDVVEICSWVACGAATRFLDSLQRMLPFHLRAIPVDKDSESQAIFEEGSRKTEMGLFVLPPRSPEINGHVEKAHIPHTEEAYL